MRLQKPLDESGFSVYDVDTVFNVDTDYNADRLEIDKMGNKSYPGEFEQMVLLAILQLKKDAYAPRVAQELEQSAGRSVSRGALYTALDRLNKKGMVRWSIEAATSERGGLPKRRFEVTGSGVEALKDSRAALLNLWRGLEEELARD